MNRFGELLRQYRERAKDPRSGRRLSQDGLGRLLGEALGWAEGYSGAAVSDWERGESQIHKDHRHVLIGLIGVLHRTGGLVSVEEAEGMLDAGGYASLRGDERSRIFPSAVRGPSSHEPDATPAWPPGIPDERYHALPGRERDLERALAALLDPVSPPIIAWSGLGGVGKTAMAVELARRALRSGAFAGVVGDSAKQEVLLSGEIVQVREATLDLDSLLDAIARQLGRWEICTLRSEDKRPAIAGLLREAPRLVLVDNLETAENADGLVYQLRPLLHACRAVVTSRKRVPHEFVFPLEVRGLETDDSLVFLRAEAARQKAESILAAGDETLAEIHAVTGGAPLALKLVVAQAGLLGLDVVLRQLQQAGGNLYPFIFRQSWEHLFPAAQRVLIYIGRTVVTTVGWDELAEVEVAESERELVMAVEQLLTHSLLEVSAGPIRYGIHPLTRQFINADLPAIWRAEGQM